MSKSGFDLAFSKNDSSKNSAQDLDLGEILPCHFHKDILFQVDKDGFQPFFSASEISVLETLLQECTDTQARILTYNELRALMTCFTKHVLSMPMRFRQVDKIKILLLGCESLLFVFQILLGLCELESWVKDIYIEVVER